MDAWDRDGGEWEELADFSRQGENMHGINFGDFSRQGESPRWSAYGDGGHALNGGAASPSYQGGRPVYSSGAAPSRRFTNNLMAGAEQAPPRTIHDIPPTWDGENPDDMVEPYLKLLSGWLEYHTDSEGTARDANPSVRPRRPQACDQRAKYRSTYRWRLRRSCTGSRP